MQEHEAELAQIEADKIKSKYSSMAAAKAKGHGIFGAIGDAISGTFDRVFKVADVAVALITDKMGLQQYNEEADFNF